MKMKAILDGRSGVIDCRKYLQSWVWHFSHDTPIDPDSDYEIIKGGPCPSENDCEAEWKAIGVVPA